MTIFVAFFYWYKAYQFSAFYFGLTEIRYSSMAIILSIETSTKTSSIAIHDRGRLISSQHIHLDKSHSEYLTLSIKYLIETSGLKMSDIDVVAISKGPGSFTGLRIGTSTAKGLCYGLNAKLISVNSLEAMAQGMINFRKNDALFCPMIDARRMEVYCLISDSELILLEETQAKILDDDAFSNLLSGHKIIFFGDGASKCKTVLSHHKNAVFIENIHPSAEKYWPIGLASLPK